MISIALASCAALILTSCASTPETRGGLYSGRTTMPSPRIVNTWIDPHPAGDSLGGYTTGDIGNASSGTFKNCKWETAHQILCTWQDTHGAGTIRLSFDHGFDRFHALWGAGRDEPANTWDGKRVVESAVSPGRALEVSP